MSNQEKETPQSLCGKHNITLFHLHHNAPTNILESPKFLELFNQFEQDIYNNQTEQELKIANDTSSSLPALAFITGIDVEWRQGSELPAVIQISSRHVCFVISVTKDQSLLTPFRKMLQDPSVVKAGVNVKEDKRRIQLFVSEGEAAPELNEEVRKSFPLFPVNGEVDLAALCCRTAEANDVGGDGLKVITEFYCDGHSLDKNDDIRCGNWESDGLTQEQLSYAGDDAVAGMLCFAEMMRRHINDEGENNNNEKNPVEWATNYLKRKVLRQSSNQAEDPEEVARRREELEKEKFGEAEKIHQNVNAMADAFADRMTNAEVEVLDLSGKVCNRVNFIKANKLISTGAAKVLEYYPIERKNNGDDDDDNDDDDKNAAAVATSSPRFVKPKNMIKKMKRIQLLSETRNSKTVLCGMFAQGKCSCGDGCSYAHGFDDLCLDMQEKVQKTQQNLVESKGVRIFPANTKNCDMCLTPDRNICKCSVVPPSFLVLMGREIAQETGCDVELFFCTKCKKLVEGMDDLRKTVQIKAKDFFSKITNTNCVNDDENNESGSPFPTATAKLGSSSSSSLAPSIASSVEKLYGRCKWLASFNPSIVAKEKESENAEVAAATTDIADDNTTNNDKKEATAKKKKKIVDPQTILSNGVNEIEILCSNLKNDDGIDGEMILKLMEKYYHSPQKEETQNETKIENNEDDAKIAKMKNFARRMMKFAPQECSAVAAAIDVAAFYYYSHDTACDGIRNDVMPWKTLPESRRMILAGKCSWTRIWAKGIFNFFVHSFETQLDPVIVPWKAFF